MNEGERNAGERWNGRRGPEAASTVDDDDNRCEQGSFATPRVQGEKNASVGVPIAVRQQYQATGARRMRLSAIIMPPRGQIWIFKAQSGRTQAHAREGGTHIYSLFSILSSLKIEWTQYNTVKDYSLNVVFYVQTRRLEPFYLNFQTYIYIFQPFFLSLIFFSFFLS